MNSRIYLSPPHMGATERQLLLEAFDSNWIAPLGPHVDAFEREFAALVGMPHAAALSSGTAALHLALEILGVGQKDTVLCATFTFAATANAIVYCGATPVFIDCDATWTIDPQLVADACTGSSRPKAIVAVDLYGQCADYKELHKIADPLGIPIIEDAAEALGSSYGASPAGSFGTMAAFSFNGNKIITTSGGGMLVSHNHEYIQRARFLATQARDPAPHYQHSSIGYNYRLSNLLAAVGRGQLQHLTDRVAARRAIYAFYHELLQNIPGATLMPEAPYRKSNRWLTCVELDPSVAKADRETLRLALEAANIESRPVWKPMHLQPVFREAPRFGGAVSERVFAQGLALPSGSSLTGSDRDRIADVVRATLS